MIFTVQHDKNEHLYQTYIMKKAVSRLHKMKYAQVFTAFGITCIVLVTSVPEKPSMIQNAHQKSTYHHYALNQQKSRIVDELMLSSRGNMLTGGHSSGSSTFETDDSSQFISDIDFRDDSKESSLDLTTTDDDDDSVVVSKEFTCLNSGKKKLNKNDLLQIPCSLLLNIDDTRSDILESQIPPSSSSNWLISTTSASSSSNKLSTPLTTYLDTGAQVTIITYQAAKKAGLTHLIDTRYAGHAVGVAGVSCHILGRIPANTVSFIFDVGNNGRLIRMDKSPAITVLENQIAAGEESEDMEMLLGLDVLEEWQAAICLRDRTLTVRSSGRRKYNKNGSLNKSKDKESVVIPFVSVRKSFASRDSFTDKAIPFTRSKVHQREQHNKTHKSSFHHGKGKMNVDSFELQTRTQLDRLDRNLPRALEQNKINVNNADDDRLKQNHEVKSSDAFVDELNDDSEGCYLQSDECSDCNLSGL